MPRPDHMMWCGYPQWLADKCDEFGRLEGKRDVKINSNRQPIIHIEMDLTIGEADVLRNIFRAVIGSVNYTTYQKSLIEQLTDVLSERLDPVGK